MLQPMSSHRVLDMIGNTAGRCQPANREETKMNYRPMVQVSGREWAGNALVFATKEEAEGNVKDLKWRWLAVTDTRVDETDAPVNYRWVDGKLEEVTNG